MKEPVLFVESGMGKYTHWMSIFNCCLQFTIIAAVLCVLLELLLRELQQKTDLMALTIMLKWKGNFPKIILLLKKQKNLVGKIYLVI